MRRVALALTGGLIALVAIIAILSGWSRQEVTGADVLPDSAPAPTPTPEASSGRLIGTYLYYWYDSVSGTHLREQDGLRYHPPASPAASWRSADWFKQQLADMHYAGIDIALPVYWGFDRPSDEWSRVGLGVLAKAWDTLDAQGGSPPRIGMYLDTTIVDWRDLTTQAGRDWLYAQVHDFFSRVPTRQWALVNGRPLVFLFTSDSTTAVNQATFDDLDERFARDFGSRPYVVREVSWDYPILGWDGRTRIRDYAHPILTANSYLWAAASHGFVDRGGVAEVGPGYDDHLVPGRGNGTVVDRQNGDFYRKAFEAAIASGKPLLAIETWNEWHEGSGIAETTEFGRQYLDITRDLAAAFHAAPTR
jgi:hypothetical protein